MKYCSTCGSKISPTEAAAAKFCSNCGNPFNKAFQPVKAAIKPKVRYEEEEEIVSEEMPELDSSDVIISPPEKLTVGKLRNGQGQIDSR